MKVFAEEKKANYGSKIATFGVEYNFNQKNKILFVVVNKKRGKNNFSPVYKTDCMTAKGGRYTFTDIQIDTDTLFNEDDDEECQIQVYKYKENGYHQKVCQGTVTYADFKNANK